MQCTLLALPASADVARISSGGAVHQLQGGGTVSMKSETVRIKISAHVQEIDCNFNFENAGPECSVRVGFPDFTNIPDLSNQETATNIRPSFLTYKCFVDGKETSTEFIAADDDFGGNDDVKMWHASTVSFPSHSKVCIRTTYTQLSYISPTDGSSASCHQFMKVTRYMLQTGASWRDPIERADIDVTFDAAVSAAPLRVVSVEEMMNSGVKSAKRWWAKASPSTIAYSSSGKPTIDGQTLHFTYTNFRPTEKDDLLFCYEPMNERKAETYMRFIEKTLAERKTPTVYIPTGWVFPRSKTPAK